MTMKEFMNKVWTANTVCGFGVIVDRRVCYGSEPDIQFTVEKFDGTGIDFINAKDMFEAELGFL